MDAAVRCIIYKVYILYILTANFLCAIVESKEVFCMKTSFCSLILASLLAVTLTGCGAESPPTTSPEETNPTTSITTTKNTVPSTTISTTTTAPSTTTTPAPSITYTYPTYTGPTYPPYTTLATSTGSLDATVTDSATTTTYYSPFAPFKDDSSAPDKDRQCLLFKVENEDVELAFESTMRYPEYNNRLLWHYTGTTKTGISVTCQVVPESGAIYSVDYGITNEWGKATTEDDVRSCLRSFIKAHQLPFDAEDASLFPTMSARLNEGKQECIINWSFSFEIEEENVRVGGAIGLSKGKLKVRFIRATTDEEGQSMQGYYGDTIALLIPRWKSE